MSKSAPRETSTLRSGLVAMPSMPSVKPEAIMESYGKMIEQMRGLNQSWMNSMQQMVDSSWDLASQLTKCGDPAEAISVYKDWANERRDALLADGKTLSSLCFKLYQNEIAPLIGLPGLAPASASAPTPTIVRSAAAGD